MITKQNIIDTAIETIQSESESISALTNYINEDFAEAIELISNCQGRLIVSGIGKSAIIANKIVATLNSTGTPSIFLHASEAIHGDLGMVLPRDVVICISKSGNSPEIKVLIPILKSFGNPIIAITGNLDSFLSAEADITLNTTVEKESCPNNLAPTNSTTAQLVMGDAIAVCLMKKNNFKGEDFAKYHPGGTLGKRTTLRVIDLLDASKKPTVTPDCSVKNAIVEISEKRLGVTAVVENNDVIGIITDGDIRRMLNRTDDFLSLQAKDIMSLNPKIITPDTMAIDALELLEKHEITQLIVKENGNYIGIIHLHDILKEGIV
ncbi:MAG: KpsF/GutQ family sugar-phosphate isomerase [Flavobacteriales bacterium]|nr:KpsF/GutQ family sugar-phosphate isomerase [Flavobacteriales bacterium]